MQKIPFLIAGNLKTGTECKMNFNFNYHGGKIEVGLPEISESDIELMKNVEKESVHNLNTNEIIDFLVKVGKLWNSKTYDKREELVDLTCKITGYSRPMIELGMQQIQGMFSKEFLEITLKNELGDKRLLDEWLPRGEALVHCQPRGHVLHILAGNVPAVSVMSMIRGILTKNCNILKMSSRDVITTSYFTQSFMDVDPEHPITKTTSTIYWSIENEHIMDKFLSFVNCVCTWGGREAVEGIRKKAPHEVELLEFGPRRGVQLIGKEAFKNLKDVTDKAAHDLTLFDQEACFSPQLVFVEEDAERYAKYFAESLKEENEKLPKGFSSIDANAIVSHTRVYSKFKGHKVIHPEKTDWTVILVNNIKDLPNPHPLGRTIFLIPVKDINESLKYISSETQVVAVEPFSRGIELRDELTIRGVDRVTHMGKMGYFAVGAPHDGMYPLSRMVRWVKSRENYSKL